MLGSLQTEGESRDRTGTDRVSVPTSPNSVPVPESSQLQVSVSDLGVADVRNVILKRQRGFERQCTRDLRQRGRGETIVQLDGATGGGGKGAGGGGSSSEESEGDDSSEVSE